jgi:hypothetical protein
MQSSLLKILAVVLLHARHVTSVSIPSTFDLAPFKINLASEVPRMRLLISSTKLPDQEVYPDVAPTFGIGLDQLKSLQEEWLNAFNWSESEALINRSACFLSYSWR